jgi:hypothetical protein
VCGEIHTLFFLLEITCLKASLNTIVIFGHPQTNHSIMGVEYIFPQKIEYILMGVELNT